ncbi:MAG: phosphotransferase family protein, partial [Alphaproteobacteria bacterium]|nr:phosphotransferase family protein [Alphaproteobacteria bacterium]
DLFAAYESAGGAPVDETRVAWWELWSALCWGIITTEMGGWIRAGDDVSVERHVIARRASETELILMAKLTGRAD